MRTHRRIIKTVLTTEGSISYRRYILRPDGTEAANKLMEIEGTKAVVPLDSMLGIDNLPFKITVPMMLEISYWAAKTGSYQEAEDFLKRTKRIPLSDDTIRQVVNFIGGLVFKEDCRQAQECKTVLDTKVPDASYSRPGVLYLQTDGAALNTRTKDANDSTWRENKLGLAFSSDNIYRWVSAKGEPQHRILRREYVSYIGSAQEFKYHLYALARRAGYGEYKETVILSDGATWIRNIKDELFPDAQQILDLFHLMENTYDFAKLIFHDNKEKYEPWARDLCTRLENGQWRSVLFDLEKYRDYPVKQGAVNLYTYIYNNRDNLNYPTYRQKGYFVGSGAIESGNKVVLQSRLKLPGMRWNIPTAQCMLALKSKIESGLWDSTVVPFISKKMITTR